MNRIRRENNRRGKRMRINLKRSKEKVKKKKYIYEGYEMK